MHDAVEKFEHEVRMVVRRGSKSIEFESSIKEVVGHFADILQEELNNNPSNREAEKRARRRIGTNGQVATQILNCASRQSKGMQIQRTLFWVPSVAALLFIGTQRIGNSSFSHLFFASEMFLALIFFLCGMAVGLGVFLAKKVVWKPIVSTYLIASIALIPIYYSGSQPTETLDGMTKPQILKLLSQYGQIRPMLGKDKKAINQIIGPSKKPFEQKYAMAASTIESSRTGQFSIDPKAVGAYLKPISIKLTKNRITPGQIQLGRTDDALGAKMAWDGIGLEFSVLNSQRAFNIDTYQIYVDYKPWPLWYIVYGSFLVPIVFLAGFVACAAIAYLGSQIWILRSEWLRFRRVR